MFLAAFIFSICLSRSLTHVARAPYFEGEGGRPPPPHHTNNTIKSWREGALGRGGGELHVKFVKKFRI